MIEKSSKMESMPIKELVMSMALPAMLSMTGLWHFVSKKNAEAIEKALFFCQILYINIA